MMEDDVRYFCLKKDCFMNPCQAMIRRNSTNYESPKLDTIDSNDLIDQSDMDQLQHSFGSTKSR